MYNKGWNKQQQMQWGPWSPQWPKPKANKKKEDKGKDKPQNVLSSYESFATSSAPSSSSAGGTQDSLLFKEFVNYMKENKDELPENIQKLIPDDGKDNIREAQRKLNKQRNILNKISNKQKALQQDQELGSMVGLSQRGNSTAKDQARRESGPSFQGAPRASRGREEDEPDGLRGHGLGRGRRERSRRDLGRAVGRQRQCKRVSEVARVPSAFGDEVPSATGFKRQRMQQIFSDQFRQLAAATMDPYMEGLGMQNIIAESAINVEELDEEQQKEEEAPKPPRLVRNAMAPFGVQRAVKTQNVSSPYSAKEKELKKLAEKEKEKAKMASLMKPPDTGQ